jgi:hypothetical protein
VDTTALRTAYRTLLETPVDPSAEPLPGEWDAEQILAHVSLVTAETIAAAARVAAGANATYDNRMTQDAWTLDRVAALAGGPAGLRARIDGQADALCAFGGSALSDAELDTPVPTLLLSHGEVLVDRAVPLRDLFTGLAEGEVPGHTRQLRALVR